MGKSDDYVIKMRLDDSDYSSKAKQTVESLEEINKKAKMKDAQDGFKNLNKEIQNTKLSGLAGAIKNISDRFTNMGIIGTTALMRITNEAITAGTRLVKSLTIDPIKSGFQEYELKMNSVQTIMASTGQSVGVVNKYLEELNKYSDDTIYSFSDMTSSIGKFTNNGVKLNDAAAAIKGIANEAALSGANANEASRAMYNFSQAISAGSVKLIDWKSIENANMATKGFKEELIKTALEVGTIKKSFKGYETITTDVKGKTSDLFNATKHFNDSLSYQWITTDVLTKTLAKYADKNTDIGKKAFEAATQVKTLSMGMDTLKEAAQSGWGETSQIIFGDIKQSVQLWTGFTNAIGGLIDKSSKERNKFLKQSLSSGWEQFVGKVPDANKFKEAYIKIAKAKGKFKGKSKEDLDDTYKFLKTLEKEKVSREDISKALEQQYKSLNKKKDSQLIEMGYTKSQIKDIREKTLLDKKNIKQLDEYVKLMNRPSGRDNIFASIYNTFKAIQSVIKPIEKAFKSTFNMSDSAKNVFKFTEKLREFTKGLILSKDASKKLQKIFEGLFGAFKKVGEVISIIYNGPIKAIIELLVEVGKRILEVSGDIGAGLSDAGSELPSIVDLIRVGSDNLTNFIKNITTWIKKLDVTAANIKEKFKPVSEFVKNIFEKSNGVNLDKTLKAGFSIPNLNFETLKEQFIRFKVWLKEQISNLNIKDALLTAFGAVEIYGIFKSFTAIGNIIKAIVSPMDALTDVLKSLSGVAKSAKGVLDAYSAKIKTEMQKDKVKIILAYAAAIALVAGSIWLIAQLPMDKLIVAGIVIGGLTAIVTGGLTKILTSKAKLNQSTDILKQVGDALNVTAKGFKAKMLGQMAKDIGKAILMLVGAFAGLFIMSKIDKKAADDVMTKFSIIIAGVAGIFFFANTKAKDFKNLVGIASIALSCMALASTLGIIVFLVDRLNKLKVDDPLALAGKFAILAVVFYGLQKAAKSMQGLNGQPVNGGSIIKMAASLLIVAGALLLLDKLEISVELVVKIGIMAGIFVAMSKMVKKMNSIDSSNSKGQFGQLMGLALYSILIVGALKLLDTMSIGSLAKSILALGGIYIALGQATKRMKTGATTGDALVIFALAVSSIVLCTTLGLLNQFDIPSLIKTVGALYFMLQGVGAAVKKASANQAGENDYKSIIAMVAVSLGVAFSLKMLSDIEWDNLLSAAGALSGTMLVLCKALQIGTQNKVEVKELLSFLAGCLMLIPIVISLKTLSESDPSNILASAGALVSVIATLAGVFFLMSKTKLDIVQMGVFALAATATLIPVVLSLMALKDIPFDQLLGIAGAIDAVIAGVAVAVVAASVAGKAGFVSGIKGLALIEVALAALIATMYAFGTFLDDENTQKVLKAGVKVFEIIGDAIGGFVGHIVGSFAKGVTSALPQIGKDLSDFGSNLNPFFRTAGKVDEGTTQSIKNLVEVMLLLTASKLVDGIANFFGLGKKKPLTEFANQLIEFGPKITQFSNSLGKIDNEKVAAASMAALLVTKVVNNLPREGGLWQKIIGEAGNLSKFAEDLIKFGPAISIFAVQVQNVKKDQVEGAVNAAKMVTEVISALPRQGGWLQDIIGTQSLSKFAAELTLFGPSISIFAKQVQDVQASQVEGAKTAALMMTEVQKALEPTSGIWQSIVGEKDLAGFAAALKAAGPNIKDFVDSVTGVDESKMEGAKKATEMMIETAGKLYDEGGVISFFTGSKVNLADFGEALSSYGESLVKYDKSISSLNPLKLLAFTRFLDGLVDVALKMQGLEQGIGWFINDLNDASVDNIKSIFEALNADLAKTSISNFIKTIKDTFMEMAKELKVSGQWAAYYFAEGIKSDEKNYMVDAAKALFLSAKKQLIDEATINQYRETGSKIGRAYLEGFSNKTDGQIAQVKSHSQKLISSIIRSLNPYSYPDLKEKILNVGKDIAKIVINGMGYSDVWDYMKEKLQQFVNRIAATIKMVDPEELKNAGVAIAKKILDGFGGHEVDSDVTDAVSNLTDKILNAIDSESGFGEAGKKKAQELIDEYERVINSWTPPQPSMSSLGYSAGTGYASGIESSYSNVSSAASGMVNAAKKSTKKTQKSKSPSKVFRELGIFAGEGYSLGMTDELDNIRKSAQEMGLAAIKEIYKLGQTEFKQTYSNPFTVSRFSNAVVQARYNAQSANPIGYERVNGIQNNNTTNNSIAPTFIQNNYSPKELSRYDIYRNTKSQFNDMARYMGGVAGI